MRITTKAGRRAVATLAVAAIAASGATAAGAQDMPTMNHASGMHEVAKTTWQGMKIAVAIVSPAQTFSAWVGTGQKVLEPKAGENVHFMIVLSDAKTGERIPYSSVNATVTAPSGKVVYSARQWPMLSPGMGMHYGNNVALPMDGTYKLKLVIGAPAVGRHVEYQKVWVTSHTVSTTFSWKGGM